MSEFQTQCWICPFCFNDSPYMHAECKADDLKMAIEFTKIENEILKKKLEIAIEALNAYSELSMFGDVARNALIEIEALENIKNKDNTLCPYCNEGQYHSWIAEEALEAIKDMGK